MNFNEAITDIVKTTIDAWNIEDYEVVSKYLTPHVVLRTEAIDIHGMETDEFNIHGLENVIDYWKAMKRQFGVKIAHYEIVEMGRNLRVMCQYTHSELNMDVLVSLNEYGKATEITNRMAKS